ncbi:RNA methyltransferase [Williamsia sp. 1138]|uniref:TrmH family RNA methyltransferase n=1 Tax=Williamsia sp. 1138 TaxID=1903117 RepID=UPI000A1003F2|nr:RNA methyltransferase [Williamsia sp. 1138]OZG29491.1 RNA methyltransferase [Williamsia sp. 1138]
MPAPDVLTERSARVVSYAKLHRSAGRRKAGTFLAEGANAVESALTTRRAEVLLATEDALYRYPDLIATAGGGGVEVVRISDGAADKLAETITSAGLFVVCDLVDVTMESVLASTPRLLAVPVEMTDPGNAGTLIRTADAMGADAVILAGDSVDPHNGKCVRSTAGSVFHIPIARERDTDEVLSALRAAGVAICATAGDGELSLPDAAEVLAGPTAWLFGNEAHGLSPNVLARADHRISIPIHGRAESLNLAAAAAICLYASADARSRVDYPRTGPNPTH